MFLGIPWSDCESARPSAAAGESMCSSWNVFAYLVHSQQRTSPPRRRRRRVRRVRRRRSRRRSSPPRRRNVYTAWGTFASSGNSATASLYYWEAARRLGSPKSCRPVNNCALFNCATVKL